MSTVWNLPSVAGAIVESVGVTEEQRRAGRTEINHQTSQAQEFRFCQTSVDVVLISPFPSRPHLCPSFCWTQLNDVPGDTRRLTTSRQDSRARRNADGAHTGVYTAHTARTLRPAAASPANCPPTPTNLRELRGTDATPFSLTSLREESRISDERGCVHLFTGLTDPV